LELTAGNFFKGLFSLKKKIEDAVIRAEMLAPSALELEEARQIKQEEMIRESNLWDDPAKSDKILVKLADIAKVVDSLKDLTYKVMYICYFPCIFYKRFCIYFTETYLVWQSSEGWVYHWRLKSILLSTWT
jgi:hypothetical protein